LPFDLEQEFPIEFELEIDGRWIAEVVALPGVLAYGVTQQEARWKAEVLARQVIAEQQ
jgi:predicted RNase H-like HicB family nuclease